MIFQPEGDQQVEGFEQINDAFQMHEMHDRYMEPHRSFDAKTYQHNQLNKMIQGVQSVQVPPVSESRAVLDSSIYVTERGEGQDGEQLQPDRHMQPDRSFDAKTYKHNQLNQIVQSIQIPPVS